MTILSFLLSDSVSVEDLAYTGNLENSVSGNLLAPFLRYLLYLVELGRFGY